VSYDSNFCLCEKHILMPVLFNLISSHLLNDVEKLKGIFKNSIFLHGSIFAVLSCLKMRRMFQKVCCIYFHCTDKLSYFRKFNEAVFVTDIFKYSGLFFRGKRCGYTKIE